MELVIEGRAWYRGKLQRVCIGIEDGRIARVRKALSGERRVDYGERIILPGMIDVHTHMREPGMTHKEDFASGTASAAFGGVTCAFDMPNTRPPTLRREDVLEKSEAAARRSWVDFGMVGGLSAETDPQRIADLVVGYKMFMSSTTGSVLLSEDRDIGRALALVRPTGRVVSVHAEDEHLLAKREVGSLREHAESRPPEAEGSAVDRLAKHSSQVRLHICHVTSRAGLEALSRGSFTSEATPHHLLLDLGSCAPGAFCKVNPPLRQREDKEALMAAFAAGRIDILASDHAPHTVGEKEQEFHHAPSGVPGVETSFPLMMMLVKRGRLSLDRLVQAACHRPAEVFGLNKGAIEEGRDADLMVLDPRAVTLVSGRRLHSKCGWTPYEGFEAVFPQAVYLRGQLMVEEGGLVGERSGRDVAARRPPAT